jgi:hypothetical protein
MKRPLAALAIKQTPGVLRSRIALRVELARDLDPRSLDYLLAHQRIAELERELAKLEGSR